MPSSIVSIHLGACLEQADIDLIDKIDRQVDTIRYSKQSCGQLYKIRQKYDGPQPRECFCASVRRKVWYKDFMTWYESYLRQVHQ